MVMKFEGPSTTGVHHDVAPPTVLQKPRMSMSDRFAARVAEQEESKNVIEAVVETAVEAAPEKSAEELAAEDKAMRERAMVRAAEIRRSRIQAQTAITTARSVLMRTADAVPMATKIERPPMPPIDPMQKIEIPGFGEAMMLSEVKDQESGEVLGYKYATPDERGRVDAGLSMDEGTNSVEKASFNSVIEITPDQTRQYIAAANAKRRFANVDAAPAEEAPANNPDHFQDRYALTG